MKYLFLFAFLILTSCSKEIKITKVIVWSPEFEVINTLENRSELEEFERHVYELVPVKNPSFSSETESDLHKIDIESTNEKLSGRWFYYKDGYLVKLSKNLQPRYKVNNAQEFENFAGIQTTH